MGVSAVVIARSIAPDGLLYCVDPWPRKGNRVNPSWQICDRELRRNHVSQKVRYVRLTSGEARTSTPDAADFIFVDGDHSLKGIATDWTLVQQKIAVGGIACFHDTTSLSGDSEALGSVEYFHDVIRRNASFEHLETCETLNVMRRVG
jgi:predicted O-methyltransferase YrrM